jgi:hypothetical protein
MNAATFVAQNPTHPWADSGYHEFIVDITDQEAADYRALNTEAFFNDSMGNLPKWQQETDGSASTYSRGSFVDPEDDQSTFTADTALADDRWIIRLYDADPGTTGIHTGSVDFDEGTGDQIIYMKLFNSDDTPSTTNAQNVKTPIGGKLMVFDFTAGVTTFSVSTAAVGTVSFRSDTRYRAVHPNNELFIEYRIFGRVLTV